jgi:hypothetical protein
MQISTIVTDTELADRFRRVFEIAPKDAWCRRAQDLAERDRRNPFLTEYLDERYSIERSLARALVHENRFGKFPPIRGPVRGPHVGRYFELYSFIHILACVYQQLSPTGQARVRGYMRNGLKSDQGLAPFAHELAVAAHLWAVGFHVEFTDAEGRTRFDMLARKEGLELEVDCKATSGDAGRQIHRRRVLELFYRIAPALDSLLQKGGARTIDVILPGSLHGAERYMAAVASAVADAVVQDKSSSVADVADVSLGTFDLREEPALLAGRPDDLPGLVERRLGRANPHAICMGTPGKAAVVVAVSRRCSAGSTSIRRRCASGARRSSIPSARSRPDEDAATGRRRDGIARAGLQSHARHEHLGRPTAHGGNEGIVVADRRPSAIAE